MSPGYYDEKLAAERLRRCYELATPMVQVYLRGEVDFLRQRLAPGGTMLELGCGYGRALSALAGHPRVLAGVDSSGASLRLAREERGVCSDFLIRMDAGRLGFKGDVFDAVVCIQNGISAFQVDRRQLVAEALRVTAPGGVALFSSYAARFWPFRLEWFEIQAAHGLVGEIDRRLTREGQIVCRDGFRAGTVSPEEFLSLAAAVGCPARITEVAGSSLFCEFLKPHG